MGTRYHDAEIRELSGLNLVFLIRKSSSFFKQCGRQILKYPHPLYVDIHEYKAFSFKLRF